jgi:hypothetical protein
MDCSSTYINRIYATIIEKILSLIKKLITPHLPRFNRDSHQGRGNLIYHGKEESLVNNNGKYRSALPGSSARIILSAHNWGYIGLSVGE